MSAMISQSNSESESCAATDNKAQNSNPESIRESLIVEMRSPIMTNIHERLSRTEKELMRTVEENKNLKEHMEQLNKDLMELHADLFQEANRQVIEAQSLQQRAEKRASELQHENEVLRSEVDALKSMMITSTPSVPNKRLHPQLDVNSYGSTQHKSVSLGKVFKGFENLVSGRKAVNKAELSFVRSTSHHEITRELSQASESENQMDTPDNSSQAIHIDPHVFQLFREWVSINSPLPNRHPPWTLEPNSQPQCDAIAAPSSKSLFLEKVFQEDVIPCLDFASSPADLTQRLLVALPSLEVEIDPCSLYEKGSQACVLIPGKLCSYRFKFKAHKTEFGDCSDSSQSFHICSLARNRLVAVCNFYNYLSLISRGLLKCALIEEQFRNVQTLRRDMSLARLGFDLS